MGEVTQIADNVQVGDADKMASLIRIFRNGLGWMLLALVSRARCFDSQIPKFLTF
jgi:hypothetical protein